MRTFLDLSKEEISHILNVAMDDGEWHSPSVSDIKLHELSNPRSVYGWCNISKHNTYHDNEVWFNINANTVQIWEKKYQKGKIYTSLHRPIHNLKKLTNILSEFEQLETQQP